MDQRKNDIHSKLWVKSVLCTSLTVSILIFDCQNQYAGCLGCEIMENEETGFSIGVEIDSWKW